VVLQSGYHVLVESVHADAERLMFQLCQLAGGQRTEDAQQHEEQDPQHRPRPGVLVPGWLRRTRTGGGLCNENVYKTENVRD